MKNEPKRLMPDFIVDRQYVLPEDRAADTKAVLWVCVGVIFSAALFAAWMVK